MIKTIGNIRNFGLSRFLDHFIPMEMQVQPEAHRRARMFMLSHVFGPVISTPLPIYMVVTGIARDYHVLIFFLSILAFWIFPFLLRATGRYQLLSFLSVQNLIFCVLWACYSFGGLSSPFLSWILIFPLLAFLYLPPQGKVRNILLAQIFGSLAIFMGLYVGGYPFPYIDLDHMQTIGMISTGAVAIYFSMMSLYFAKMFQEQREFAREINALISTSDNLRNLTVAANQASAAKADFISSMSHELRTPLNAIIGYSQMLQEEAREEQNEEMEKDLGYVNKAGTDLLRLIDDILDYSRIEAGKMPVNPFFDSCRKHVEGWVRQIREVMPATREFDLQDNDVLDQSIMTDWSALQAAVCHLVSGVASQHNDGHVSLAMHLIPEKRNQACALAINIFDYDAQGNARATPMMQEMFEHNSDASSSKYGDTGIEIALSFKFAQLLEGSISSLTTDDGRPVTQLLIPDLSAPQQQAA